MQDGEVLGNLVIDNQCLRNRDSDRPGLFYLDKKPRIHRFAASTTPNSQAAHAMLLSPLAMPPRLPDPTISFYPRRSSSISVETAPTLPCTGNQTDRSRIAKKTNLYAWLLPWSMKLETREQYLRGLCSISHIDDGRLRHMIALPWKTFSTTLGVELLTDKISKAQLKRSGGSRHLFLHV